MVSKHIFLDVKRCSIVNHLTNVYIYRGDEKDNHGEHTLQDERDALICDMPEINMVCFNIVYFMQVI